MQHGIVITTGSPVEATRLATEAEAAGWDGVFTWDAIAIGDTETWDPWIMLAAMAVSTSRVRLGAMVFAPTRRRPWKVAREVITLDHLSGGRLVVPVGLGAVEDLGFGNVGEAVAPRDRARLLDETLAILDGLQSGEPFGFEGERYRFGAMTLRPRPVQRPRVPVWVVGAWPHERSLQRAIRWDGMVVQGPDADGNPSGTPVAMAEIAAWVARERASAGLEGSFDLVVGGTTPADDPGAAADVANGFAEAGATWWVESDWAAPSVDALRARIAAGPPRA